MLKRNVVIRPLQEELRALGILEQDQEKPAPKPDPEGGYAAEQGDEEPQDEPPKPKAEQEEPEDDDEVETEALDAIKTLSAHFLGVHEQDEPEDDDDEPMALGPNGEPVGESRIRRLRRLAEGRIFSSRKSARPKSPHRVTALLEEVSGIVGDIHRSRREDRIQGFANIAVISEMLSRRFCHWGMSLSEGRLYKVGEVMAKLHEQAADMAIGLDTPPGEKPDEQEEPPIPGEEEPAVEQDDAQVDDLFKKLMAKLLDALQLYNDVTGKSEQEEVPDEEEPEFPAEQEEPPVPPPSSDDDDEEPEGIPMPPEDAEESDEEEPEGKCPECEEEEPPSSKPPEDDTVTEARRTLAELRKRLADSRRRGPRKEALTVSGKARKGKSLKSQNTPPWMKPKQEKKGKKR